MESLQSLGNVLLHWLFGHTSQLFLKGLKGEIRTRLSIDPAPIIKAIKEWAIEILESDKKLVKDTPCHLG